MNQKLLSGITATLLISTLGLAPSGYADQAESASNQSGESVSEAEATSPSQRGLISDNPPTQALPATQADAAALSSTSDEKVGEKVSAPAPVNLPPAASPTAQASSPENPVTNGSQPQEAVKVGEYQSQASPADAAVANIQQHQLRGRQAVTLYVRNIPVLTFLGDQADQASAAQASNPEPVSSSAEVKIASTQATAGTAIAAGEPDRLRPAPDKAPAPLADASAAEPAQDSRDPVWRATTVAARLNQLYRDNVNASDIKISWKADRKQSVISANEVEIVSIDDQTVLPDTASSSDGDMLQVTNRIRRQMGGASPLSSIEGKPEDRAIQVSLGNINLRASGYASWYGPGFEGAYSASGEPFNQNAMTAAHPSLPFGTQVRVTNMDNGQSVVVRINDRGPFAHDRVIDLSAGAARIIGLIQAGVAPVSLEVLGAAQAAN